MAMRKRLQELAMLFEQGSITEAEFKLHVMGAIAETPIHNAKEWQWLCVSLRFVTPVREGQQ